MSEKFGVNLRNARMNKGLSQQSLADKINVAGANTICKWEKGINEPDILAQEMMSAVLDVSLDDLVKGNIYLNPDIIKKFRAIPQIKLNSSVYDKDLPRCEVDMTFMPDTFYDCYDTDKEAFFAQCLINFGGAYHLESAILNNGSSEIYAKIENLYKSAWADGEGLYEAGINLFRFWIIRDIEEQRRGGEPFCDEEQFVLLQRLIDHDSFYCGFEEIVSFYRAVFRVFGLYCAPVALYDKKQEYKRDVDNYMYDGYEEMVVLADKQGNPYARTFLDGLNSEIVKLARENLKNVSAYEYWNHGQELDSETKAFLEYMDEITKVFDEAEDAIFEEYESAKK